MVENSKTIISKVPLLHPDFYLGWIFERIPIQVMSSIYAGINHKSRAPHNTRGGVYTHIHTHTTKSMFVANKEAEMERISNARTLKSNNQNCSHTLYTGKVVSGIPILARSHGAKNIYYILVRIYSVF